MNKHVPVATGALRPVDEDEERRADAALDEEQAVSLRPRPVPVAKGVARPER